MPQQSGQQDQQGQQGGQPKIVTDWFSDDDTNHRLEAALTDIQAEVTGSGVQRVMAIHNTQQPGHILTCTTGEFQQLVDSARGGSVGKMLSTAGGGASR